MVFTSALIPPTLWMSMNGQLGNLSSQFKLLSALTFLSYNAFRFEKSLNKNFLTNELMHANLHLEKKSQELQENQIRKMEIDVTY